MPRWPTPLPWRSLLRNLLRHDRVERDLAAELESFLAERTAELVREGAGEAAARRRARLEMGGVEQVRERVREVRTGRDLLALGGDLRLAGRLLRRDPGFAAVVVLTLALGIGGTTALFSVAAAVTLRGLPYPEPERLVHVQAYWPGGSGNASFLDYRALRERARSFETIAAYEPWGGVALTSGERPLTVEPNFVTADYFALLGARPALGRSFDFPPGDDGAGDHRVAVVSHAFWQGVLGGDPGVVGRAIGLNGLPFTVVGVMPQDFQDLSLAEGGAAAEVWLPAGTAPPLIAQAPMHEMVRIYWIAARLRPGVSLAAAREEIAAVAAELDRELPETHDGYGLEARSMTARLHGPFARPTLLVAGGALLLLLVACGNLAGALGARLARRRPELALRAALGASTFRLLRQLVVETALLAALGALAGLVLAAALTRVIGEWVRANLSAVIEARMDASALACVTLLGVGAALLFAAGAAREGRSLEVRSAMGDGGRTGRRRGWRDRGGRIVLQVALTTVLLVAAGLMLRSVAELGRRDVGYRPAGLLTFQLDLTSPRYAERPARIDVAGRVEEALDAIPGAGPPALLGPSPLSHATWVTRVRPAERAGERAEDYTVLFRHSVNPGALAQLGIPLRQGRDFTAADGADAPLVAIVSEAVAREMWPGRSALGRPLYRPHADQPPFTVVGVAADVAHRRRYSLDDVAEGLPAGNTGPQRDIYLPYPQIPNSRQTWALRATGDPAHVLAAARRAVAAVDPDLPLVDPVLAEERLRLQEGVPGALAALLGGFALFALLLAVVGVYGVAAQSVQQGIREIGVRLVLGARPARIVGALLARGVAPVLAGAAIGLAGSVALVPAMAAFLVGVEGLDALTLALVLGLLLAAGLLTTLAPARRVLGGEALRSLRGE